MFLHLDSPIRLLNNPDLRFHTFVATLFSLASMGISDEKYMANTSHARGIICHREGKGFQDQECEGGDLGGRRGDPGCRGCHLSRSSINGSPHSLGLSLYRPDLLLATRIVSLTPSFFMPASPGDDRLLCGRRSSGTKSLVAVALSHANGKPPPWTWRGMLAFQGDQRRILDTKQSAWCRENIVVRSAQCGETSLPCKAKFNTVLWFTHILAQMSIPGNTYF